MPSPAAAPRACVKNAANRIGRMTRRCRPRDGGCARKHPSRIRADGRADRPRNRPPSYRSEEPLAHGEYEAMIERDLPFSSSTAQRLAKIAHHPVLSKAAHAQALPPSWMTLYELTKVPEPLLAAMIKDGTVNPVAHRHRLWRRGAIPSAPVRASDAGATSSSRCAVDVADHALAAWQRERIRRPPVRPIGWAVRRGRDAPNAPRKRARAG